MGINKQVAIESREHLSGQALMLDKKALPTINSPVYPKGVQVYSRPAINKWVN